MAQIIRIKNTGGSDGTWAGVLLPAGVYVDLDPEKMDSWRRSIQVFQDVGSGTLVVNKGSDTVDDIDDPIQAWNWILGNPATDADGTPLVSLGNKTSDDRRNVMAVNRIPSGYTVYYTGCSDDIANGVYGGGNQLVLKSDTTQNKTMEFRLLDHFYISGGRAIWNGASFGDYMDVNIVAPACSGASPLAGGNYTKIEVAPGSGMNIIVPVSAGTGDWDLDLTSTTSPSNNILSCTPVPNVSKSGWFNYDPFTNQISVAPRGDGSYDLYDFDVIIFRFLKNGWAKPGSGAETDFEASDVISKLFFNSWKLVFNLVSSSTTAECYINMAVASKKNV